jgi:hypothetical protein
MAYPWFIAFPAALVWLVPPSPRAEQDEGEDPDARKACLQLLVAVPTVHLVVECMIPGYLPLDMIASAPLVVIVAAWGLARAPLLEGGEMTSVLLPLGAVLVMLGAGSQGVDMFWNPKRILEASGYMFDRVYPDIGRLAQGFHTGLAILVGASAAPLAFARRRASVIPAVLLAAALAVAGFEALHVSAKVEPYLSVGPLARAYRGRETGSDLLSAIELDPQIRGGHVFYFRRAMEDEGDIERLPLAIDRAAGRGRLVLVTSHVRELYNDAYVLTCGTRIEPLNEERRWYAISTLESAPAMPSYRILVPGGRAGARIGRPAQALLRHQGRQAVTFLGWNASPGGDPIHVARRSWIDIELFFRAESALETGWRVLLDAVGPAGGEPIKGHHLPACGRYPSHLWRPWDVIRDRYFLLVPAGASPGTYRLRTGLYRGDDRMTMQVEGPPGTRPRQQATIVLGSFVVD